MRISAFTADNIQKSAILRDKDGVIYVTLWHHNVDCEWFYGEGYLIQRENFREDIAPRKYKVPKKAEIIKHDNPLLSYEIRIGKWPNEITIYAKPMKFLSKCDAKEKRG